MLKTIYASIGNSDDKLTQRQWADFVEGFVNAINDEAEQVHGVWLSEFSAPFQNACVCFEIHEGSERELLGTMSQLRSDYLQDSIAWSVADTRFI